MPDNSAPALSSDARWYYSHSGNVVGPMPLASIRALWQAKELPSDTLGTLEGTEDWQQLADVLGPLSVVSPPALLSPGTMPALPDEPEKWFERTGIVLASLFFCFPAGLLFLWKSRRFSLPMKIGLTLPVLMFATAFLLDSQEAIERGPVRKPVAKSESKEPVEYKLACIDAGFALPKSSPKLAEYKRVLAVLAAQFEVTKDRVAEQANAVADILQKDQIKATRLEMMQAVEKATAGNNTTIVGKGNDALASIFATIATLMKASSGEKVGASVSPEADGVILKNATLFADKETLQLLDSTPDKGAAFRRMTGEDKLWVAGQESLVKGLESTGKVWVAERDLMVNVLENGGPMNSVFVEAVNGGIAKRFWVASSQILPINSVAGRWAADPSKQAEPSSFKYVLDGTEREVGSVVISHLMELVAGLYVGAIQQSDAKKCLVLNQAIGGQYPSDFQQVVGDYLVYDGVLTVHEHYNFGIVREPLFEEGYDDLGKLYNDIRRSQHHSANPLHRGGLIFVGMEQFTTQGGFVRQIPVFRVMNVQP